LHLQHNIAKYVYNYLILFDDLIGLHVLPNRLTGNHCRDFLLHDLPKLQKVVMQVVRTQMWYMHDGAPAQFSRVVRDVLSHTYHDRWIGTGGSTAWLPRSPVLNLLDFYPLGRLRTLTYAAPDDKKTQFTVPLWVPVRLSATILSSLNGCGVPGCDVSRRAMNTMEAILSTYYKLILSAITHILYVSESMLIWAFFLVWYVELVSKFCPQLLVMPCKWTDVSHIRSSYCYLP
jgi:hypothetical protein